MLVIPEKGFAISDNQEEGKGLVAEKSSSLELTVRSDASVLEKDGVVNSGRQFEITTVIES